VTSRISSIVPVWIAVVAGIVLIAVLADPGGYYRWLGVALACAVLLTFVVQLAVPGKEGLVRRMLLSIGGSVILLAIATAVLALLHV
jgi:hypothetical protein